MTNAPVLPRDRVLEALALARTLLIENIEELMVRAAAARGAAHYLDGAIERIAHDEALAGGNAPTGGGGECDRG
jgi:hypothetical protein